MLHGSDFVSVEDSQGTWLVVVNQKSILKLIGETPNAIAAWVAAIDRGEPVDSFLNKYVGKASVEDYAERFIQRVSDVNPSDTLMPFVHDGLGFPYIPGSSLKGAIRTAVVATLATEKYKGEFPRNSNVWNRAKFVEEQLLGKTPSEDVFRFLHVGDARFGDYSTQAVRLYSINECKSQSWWDTSRSQLVEALCQDDSAIFDLKLDLKGHALSKIQPLPFCMESLPTLFETINAHTKKLLDEEVLYWEERAARDEEGKVDRYIEKVKNLLQIVGQFSKAGGKSCILRVGAGSGWRFITGAWSEAMSDFEDVVIPAARRNNSHYSEYKFPKTRRIDHGCGLLGFVQLTLQEE